MVPLWSRNSRNRCKLFDTNYHYMYKVIQRWLKHWKLRARNRKGKKRRVRSRGQAFDRMQEHITTRRSVFVAMTTLSRSSLLQHLPKWRTPLTFRYGKLTVVREPKGSLLCWQRLTIWTFCKSGLLTLSYLTSLRSILTFFSHICIDVLPILCPWRFFSQNLYACLV